MAIIVDIDHEANDLSEYTSTVEDAGDLSADADAALAGTGFGLQCVIDDNTVIYGRIDFTISTDDLRLRFYLDPNGATPGNGNNLSINELMTAGGLQVFTVRYQGTATGTKFQIQTKNDESVIDNFSSADITDAEHYIEFHLERATSVSADDGRYRIWIDGNLEHTRSNVDAYDLFPDIQHFKLGMLWNQGSISATIFADQLVVRDDATLIGAHVEPSGSSTAAEALLSTAPLALAPTATATVAS